MSARLVLANDELVAHILRYVQNFFDVQFFVSVTSCTAAIAVPFLRQFRAGYEQLQELLVQRSCERQEAGILGRDLRRAEELEEG